MKTLSLISFGPEKKKKISVTQFGVLSGCVYGLRLQEAAFLNEDPGFRVLNLFEFYCSEISLTAKCEFLDFVLPWWRSCTVPNGEWCGQQ